MKEKLSTKSMAILAAFVIIGLAITIHTIIYAVRFFYLPVLVIQLLEISGLIWAYYYVFGNETKSKPFFISMFSNIGLILLLVYSLFPDIHLSEGIRRLTVAISIMGLICIVYILSNWDKFKICIPVSYFVGTCFIILACIDSTMIGKTSSEIPTAMAISDIWARPVFAMTVLGCYVARMRQKFAGKGK